MPITGVAEQEASAWGVFWLIVGGTPEAYFFGNDRARWLVSPQYQKVGFLPVTPYLQLLMSKQLGMEMKTSRSNLNSKPHSSTYDMVNNLPVGHTASNKRLNVLQVHSKVI